LAFTRIPSDTSSFPAEYIGTEGNDSLFLVDQPSEVLIEALDGEDVIDIIGPSTNNGVISDFAIYGNGDDDLIQISATNIVDSLVQGGGGKDVILIGDFDRELPFLSVGAVSNSIVRGGADSDFVSVQSAQNGTVVNGNKGNDQVDIYGNTNGVRAYGGSENDEIYISSGTFNNSSANGSAGADTIWVGGWKGVGVDSPENVGTVSISNSSIWGGSEDDIFYLLGDYIESDDLLVSGDKGNDNFFTRTQRNVFGGFAGGVTGTFNGGEGNDTAQGTFQTDKLGETNTFDMGVGADTLILENEGGVAAKDTYVFNSGDSVAATKLEKQGSNRLRTSTQIRFANGVDTIWGLDATDKIDIDFTPATRVVLSPGQFAPNSGAKFSDVLDANTVYEIYGDANPNTGLFEVSFEDGGNSSLYIVGGEGKTLEDALNTSENIFISDRDLTLDQFI